MPSYGYLVFVTHKQNIKDEGGKDIIRRFLRAVSKSVDYTLKEKEEALSGFLEIAPLLDNELTRKAYSATLKCFRTNTSLQLEEWERLAEFTNKAGLIFGGNGSQHFGTTIATRVTGKELIANSEDLR